MQEFQKRVVDEKKENDERLMKLDSFISGDIFASLPAEEQARMKKQSEVMSEFSDILGSRIEAFV